LLQRRFCCPRNKKRKQSKAAFVQVCTSVEKKKWDESDEKKIVFVLRCTYGKYVCVRRGRTRGSSKDLCYDFLNIFAEKFCKKLAFLTQNKAKFGKKFIITLVFDKNANFFAENCQKSQKIVIITSVPRLCFGVFQNCTPQGKVNALQDQFFKK
jgi:hypothetical protein